ncbi:MAG: c-type cytochrome [Gemmatimonadaceae bacterium]|nr:c-type cytochrome [Gemmatimonadaceae bacterium]
MLCCVLVACGGDVDTTAPIVPATTSPNTTPVALRTTVIAPAAAVGASYALDATANHTTFSDPRNTGLSYAVTFSPNANGLSATQGHISGVPSHAGIVTVNIVATDLNGYSASHSFPLVTFAATAGAPTLPAAPHRYADATSPLPAHFFVQGGAGGSAIATDNTPANNPTTDAGAALGRVLFYDRRLSVNDGVACASCHQQQFAFSDTVRLSRGFAGGVTGRHSMGLANARFYQRGRFFWDERAATLEAQVLQPIQDPVEMGMSLPNLLIKLNASPYYARLFQAAFGSAEITTERVARALAQFVRAMVSGTSKFDRAFTGAAPNFAAVFNADELAGQQLFNGQAACARCHGTVAFVGDAARNTGLDGTIVDAGAGNGTFKSPSLKNIAVRAPYMHDGRFRTLEEVVDFYNTGVQNNPGLDQRLRGPGGAVTRLGLNNTQRAQLVAFLRTLTDSTFLTDPKFASPFP